MPAPCDSRAKDNCIFVNLVNQTSLSSITFTAPLAILFRKGSPVRRIIFEVVLGLLFLAAAGFGGWTWMQQQEMEAALVKATTTAGEAEAKTSALTAERDAAQQRIPDLLQKEALLDAAKVALSSGQVLQDLEAMNKAAKTPSADRYLALGALRLLIKGKEDPEVEAAFQKALELADWSSRLRAVCAAQAGLSAAGKEVKMLTECKPEAAEKAAEKAAEPKK
jgi:hypothetical protein